jgi:hypothetical protein
VWERQGSRLIVFEGFGLCCLVGFGVVGVFVVAWVLGLWKLPVYTSCIIKGALRFNNKNLHNLQKKKKISKLQANSFPNAPH